MNEKEAWRNESENQNERYSRWPWDDIIELSDEELKEILADDDFDDSEEYGEMTEIMPVPRKLRITVLPAGSLTRPFFVCFSHVSALSRESSASLRKMHAW